MQNLDNYVNYIAYAAGFATGNFVGMIIEEKLAVGVQMIRIFTYHRGTELLQDLNMKGFGATVVEAQGAKEKVQLIYTIVQRNDLEKVLNIINHFNPKAFYTIEDVKAVNEGIFPIQRYQSVFPISNVVRQWRKGK